MFVMLIIPYQRFHDSGYTLETEIRIGHPVRNKPYESVPDLKTRLSTGLDVIT